MSDAGLGASLMVITHLRKHTKPWTVSALWRHTCWHVTVVALLSQLPNVDLVCSDICAHGSRHAKELDFCAGTSTNWICCDFDFCATLGLGRCASFEAKLTLLDPRQKPASPPQYPPQLAEAIAFLLTSAAKRGDIRADGLWSMIFIGASVAHDSFALDSHDLSFLWSPQKQYHLQFHTSSSRVTSSQLGICS